MTSAELKFYEIAPIRLYNIEKHLEKISGCLATLTEVAERIYGKER